MKSYVQGIFTGVAISISVLLIMGAQKNHSNIILEMIIEDQKEDIQIKEQVKKNRIKIKNNHMMIDEKFRTIYRYLGENCPCFDNLFNDL
tara:strand:- start:152 stop:421 length:270 start_codon:yes stop_codon:yes gene_type:complete